MNSGKPAFMSNALRPASSSFRETSPEALTLLGEARFIAWRLRCPFLGECRRIRDIFVLGMRVWVTDLRLDPPKKPCATLVQSVGPTTNTDSQRKDSNRQRFERARQFKDKDLVG